MDNKEGAVVIFSGGQDSTACLFWAAEKFGKENLIAMTFSYGQRHFEETAAAAQICQKHGFKQIIVPIDIYSSLAKNPLFENACALLDEELKIQVDEGKQFPNTFVPARNLLFLTYGTVLASFYGVKNLVIGVSQVDFSGYPDCRDDFIQKMNAAISSAMGEEFKIHTPLIDLSKAQTWKLVADLGVFEIVKNETLTCYNGIKADGCGVCPACRLRKNGLIEYEKAFKD